METYIDSRTNILHRCKIDGYEWMAKPANILTGYGCPKCSGCIKKTHQEYVDRVKKINPNIDVLGEYNGRHKKILHKCKIDGYKWCATPNSYFRWNRMSYMWQNISNTKEKKNT